MTLVKQAPRRRKIAEAAPVFGVAGLSLSLVNGASAAMAERPGEAQHVATSHEIILSEEEISDVSLATFYVFDKENGPTSRSRIKLAQACGACGGGCGGCGCWTGTYYSSSVFGDNGNPRQAKLAHKHPRRAKPAQSSKNSQ